MRPQLSVLTLLLTTAFSCVAFGDECDYCAVALNPQLMTKLKVKDSGEFRSRVKQSLDLWKEKSTKQQRESGGGGGLNVFEVFKLNGEGRSSEEIERDLKLRYIADGEAALDSSAMHEFTAQFMPKEAWKVWRDCVTSCSQELSLKRVNTDPTEIMVSLRYNPKGADRKDIKIAQIEVANATVVSGLAKNAVLKTFGGGLIKIRRANTTKEATLSISFEKANPLHLVIPAKKVAKPPAVNTSVRLANRVVTHVSTLPDGGHKIRVKTGAVANLAANNTELRITTRFDFKGGAIPNVANHLLYRAPAGYKIKSVKYPEDVNSETLIFDSDLKRPGFDQEIKTYHYQKVDGGWPKTAVPTYHGFVRKFHVKCTFPYRVRFELGNIDLTLEKAN